MEKRWDGLLDGCSNNHSYKTIWGERKLSLCKGLGGSECEGWLKVGKEGVGGMKGTRTGVI